MAVERHRSFEAQRVASTEAAWPGAASDQVFPQFHRRGLAGHHFEAIFARIAGSTHDALLAVVPRRRAEVALQLADINVGNALADLKGLRSLHGDHAGVERLVCNRDVSRALMLVQPGDDLLAVRGIHHYRPAVGPAVNEHVVENATLLIAHETVADL